ncbi:MAG: hypothetical protein CMG55_08425 [Candidatus Marinimicrobia bacterium]|nr:hypothetical protein [Candidatus Neomarinimicrobiota bacterium]
MVTDEFPYFTRCLKGEIANGGGGVPDCEDVPPGNPCCGDGICGGPENEDNCPIDCATGNTGPSLINFSIYGDTVNTSQESINIGFTLNAEDSDDYLSSYILRLIINGGPINGGEMLESSGLFAENVMSSTIASSIEIPMGSTEGTWNIRIILEDNFGTITNLGPNDLENQNFQNYIYVNNAILGSNYENVPIQYFLHQNYPNPFNPVTTLQYNLPEDIFVKITIYDMLGNVISNLISEVQNTGYKSVQWNATNNQGQPVSAGLYLYSIDTRKFRKTKKMILIK